MDVNELIGSIAREVLNQLRGEAQAPCVSVLADRDDALAEKIRPHLGEGDRILFSGEAAGDTVPYRYILPYLSCSDMADLAIGRASGGAVSEVLSLLLSGREVEVLEFGYQAYGETAPGPLYELYAAYGKTLATYGLVEFRRRRPDTIRFREGLVTEKNVERAHEDGASTLMVPASAVITPLALEAADRLHINILKGL
ncbi:MAG: hypothetical protein ACNI3A_07640 [Desulfovibrio sp.]|uniref:hypothetical protein n=1 Tax=Desulfovibrio sp. 7SRBS1 TaxID=3378064 RepID=UPI003B3DADA0